MILSRRIRLDGVHLDSIDDKIIISGFEEEVPEETRSVIDMIGRVGSQLVNEHMSKKKVTVKFLLKVRKNNFQERNEILEKITGWARNGRVMLSSTRPGRMLLVHCTQGPKPTDPRNWTSEYTMNFEAMERPFWENTTLASIKSGTKAKGDVTLEVDGNLPNAISIQAKNMSGAVINKMKFTCGSYSMSFASLALAANETLVIDYTQELIQRIRVLQTNGSYRSVMDKRTGSDDLRTNPGTVKVSFDCERAIQLTASCYGRYA